jgi:1-acyl-sn-glycerol-3-phosphate acyltransferase
VDVDRSADRPPWAWRVVLGAVVGLFRRVLGWRVRARPPAVLPTAHQPLVVVFNHTSNVDAFLVADTVWRRLRHWSRPLVKQELFDVPVLGLLARGAGAIPVLRGEGAGREAAYGAAVERLQAGGTVLLAPEGTITHDGSLLPLRHGAARMALGAGVDVLVVTHFGAQRAFSPVVRTAERRVVVAMAFDLLHPWPGEDASALTGRIAATMIDRSEELRADYPQQAPDASWWPPYARPASPSETARDNLERYRHSMAEAVSQARTRMAEFAVEHDVDQRVAAARARADELTDEARHRLDDFAEQTRDRAEELAQRTRVRTDELTDEARHRLEELTERTRHRAEEITDEARQLLDELTEDARHRFDELVGRRPEGDDRAGSASERQAPATPPPDRDGPGA